MKQQRYVMIRGQVFRWEEKAPFVESGESVLGAVEVNPETRESKCHECGGWFKKIGSHLSGMADHPGAREYKTRHGLRLGSGVGFDNQRVHNLRSAFTPETSKKARAARRTHGGSQGAEYRNAMGTCDAQIPFRLQEWVAQHGKIPTAADVGRGFAEAARVRYGSWNRALEAAGMETKGRHRPKIYGAAIIVEMLRDFYVYNQRLPHDREWGHGRLPGRTTVYRIFGSIKALYEAAGLGLVAEGRCSAA